MQHATKAYGQVAQQTASPRELEVQLLLRAASRLQAVHDDWDARAPARSTRRCISIASSGRSS